MYLQVFLRYAPFMHSDIKVRKYANFPNLRVDSMKIKKLRQYAKFPKTIDYLG